MNETSEPPLFDAQSAISARDVLARALARAALAAGPAVMEEYARGAEARAKADGSPVTVADERAEAIIRERLEKLAPSIPIIAEEAVAAGAPLTVADQFFLVDPLDGTREFIARNGEFTINIALVSLGAPVAAAVYAPALDRLWFAGELSFVCNVAIGANLPRHRIGDGCGPARRRNRWRLWRAVPTLIRKRKRSCHDCRSARANLPVRR